jgi:hypothetical protein
MVAYAKDAVNCSLGTIVDVMGVASGKPIALADCISPLSAIAVFCVGIAIVEPFDCYIFIHL